LELKAAYTPSSSSYKFKYLFLNVVDNPAQVRISVKSDGTTTVAQAPSTHHSLRKLTSSHPIVCDELTLG